MTNNNLCKLKGCMWFVNKRKEEKREDGIYSIPVEEKCARCGDVRKFAK